MPLAARILVVTLALMTATCGQKGPLTPPANAGLITVPQAGDASSMTQSRARIEAAHSA